LNDFSASDPFHGLLYGHCPCGDQPTQVGQSLLSHCPKNGGNFKLDRMEVQNPRTTGKVRTYILVPEKTHAGAVQSSQMEVQGTDWILRTYLKQSKR